MESEYVKIISHSVSIRIKCVTAFDMWVKYRMQSFCIEFSFDAKRSSNPSVGQVCECDEKKKSTRAQTGFVHDVNNRIRWHCESENFRKVHEQRKKKIFWRMSTARIESAFSFWISCAQMKLLNIVINWRARAREKSNKLKHIVDCVWPGRLKRNLFTF